MRRITVAVVLAIAMCGVGGAGADRTVNHSHRFDVAQRVKAGLDVFDHARPIPMRSSYWAAEAAGHFYNVNPAVMLGIAAKESQLGRTACGFNAFGFASCGTNSWLDLPRNLCRWFRWPASCGDGRPDPVPHLRSWSQSLWLMAWQIRTRYLDRGVSTVSGILTGGYCSGCPGWDRDVTNFMSPFQLGYGVAYP